MNHQSRPVSTFKVPKDGLGTHVDITILVSALRAENLHFMTWSSARILTEQLYKIQINPSSLDRSPIIELGAGTGLVGLAAATLWRRQVILTDLEPFVPGLADNIAANQEVLASNSASAVCGTLDWEHPEKLRLHHMDSNSSSRSLSSSVNKASIILAADTIYSDEHPRMLATAILAWLRPTKDSRAVICYPLRVAYLDAIRELWERLENGGLVAVDEGKSEIEDERWDDERLHEWSIWRWRDSGPGNG